MLNRSFYQINDFDAMYDHMNDGLSFVEGQEISNTVLTFAIKQGNVLAFQYFYKRFYMKLLVQLKLLSNNHHLAEDLCQETFVRLWENKQHLDPERSLTAYVRKIAHNLLVDMVRKQTLQKVYDHQYQIAKPSIDSVSIQMDRKEFQVHLEQALQLLPKEKQKIYRLSREELLSYKEIAKLENTTPKAIERHIARTNSFLKKYLAEHLDVVYCLLLCLFY